MTSFVLKAVIVFVLISFRKSYPKVKFSVVHISNPDIFCLFLKYSKDIFFFYSVIHHQPHQLFDEFIFCRMFTYIDTSLFRNMQAESVFFVRHTDISEFFLYFFRELFQTCLHLIHIVIRLKEMIEGNQWIIQTDLFFSKSKFFLFFFYNIDQIFFQTFKSHFCSTCSFYFSYIQLSCSMSPN